MRAGLRSARISSDRQLFRNMSSKPEETLHKDPDQPRCSVELSPEFVEAVKTLNKEELELCGPVQAFFARDIELFKKGWFIERNFLLRNAEALLNEHHPNSLLLAKVYYLHGQNFS